MKATFSRKTIRKGNERIEVDWVTISGLPAGDVVSRAATDRDRLRFKEAYRALKASMAPIVPPTQAQIAKHLRKGKDAG